MPKKAAPRQKIEPDALYTSREVRRTLGIGDFSWRALRRAGLPEKKIGSQLLILGSEFIEFYRGLKVEKTQRDEPLMPHAADAGGSAAIQSQ